MRYLFDMKTDVLSKNKFWSRLINRLLGAVLVFVLPVCMVAVLLTFLVMTRASEQVMNSYRGQIDSALQRMQDDMDVIAVDMDDFVNAYVTELSLSGYHADEMKVYEMFTDLSDYMKRSGLSGVVSIYERESDRILLQQQEISGTADVIDRMFQSIRNEMRTDGTLEQYTYRYEEQHLFLVRNYDYSNYEVMFWFDLGENISDVLKQFYENQIRSELLVRAGDVVYEINEQGRVTPVEREWDRCIQPDLHARTVTWNSDTMPVQVCMRAHIQTWQMIPPGYWLLLLATIGCQGMVVILWFKIRKEVIFPIERLNQAMHEIQKEHLDYRIEDHSRRNSTEIQYLYDTFDKMAGELKLSVEKDKEMHQTQMDNLRLQVNPHMLLNSFNTIYSLAQTQNYECIQEYSLHLVDYFRYALRKNEDMVPLRQELDFVQNYIEIQKIRFPKAFSWVYKVEESCENALIPPLLVENFVENSMKYALTPGKMIEVLLNIRREGDRLLISVSDTGRGIKPEILEELQKGNPYVDRMGNKHIGIWNCKRRVELYYGEEALLNIVSTAGEGTQIFMNIPFVEEREHETFNR